MSRLKYETYYSYYTPDSTQKGMDKKIGFRRICSYTTLLKSVKEMQNFDLCEEKRHAEEFLYFKLTAKYAFYTSGLSKYKFKNRQ